MKVKSFSTKDVLMVAVLLIILIAVVYYMAFLKPLQAEVASLETKSAELDTEVAMAAARVGALQSKQEEVAEILALPESQQTEIAPYDNKNTVMNRLNEILASSENYKLSFSDPQTDDNGIVRRVVTLSFTAASYSKAKTILKSLANWNYRSQIGNLTVAAADETLKSGDVTVTATITFFESVNLSA